MPDFQLPPNVNEFSSESFSCRVSKLKKETKETQISFECGYEGKALGKVNPNQVTLKLENNQSYANDEVVSEPIALFEKEQSKINISFHVPARVTDMQFANMIIQWNDTFSESKLEMIPLEEIKLILDPGKTDGHNR